MPWFAPCLALCLASLVASAPVLSAQAFPQFTRVNAIDVSVAYGNNSSHILLGEARNRKVVDWSVGYSRRILRRRFFDLQYRAELSPTVFVGDPVIRSTQTTTYNSQAPANFQPGTFTYDFRQAGPCRQGIVADEPILLNGVNIGQYTVSNTCGRHAWTWGQALRPAGLKLNLRPRQRVQPVATLLGGYLFTTEPVPTDGAGSFNFIFSAGAGVEIFLRPSPSAGFLRSNRSLRLEYRVQHISDKNSSPANPGIDNGLVQVSYSFGR